MGDSLEASDSAPEAQNVAVVEFTAFANYLRKAANILLPEDNAHTEPPALNSALEDKAIQDAIRKFLCDPQVSTLYVQRSSSKGEKLLPPRHLTPHEDVNHEFMFFIVELRWRERVRERERERALLYRLYIIRII